MLIATAYAQDASGGILGGLGPVAQFLPLVLIFGVFYFLLIRPNQQQQKALKASLAQLKRGDRVVTGGGIVGTVQAVRDGSNEIEVEIAPNVRVSVVRETINNVVKPTAANDRKPVTAPVPAIGTKKKP
jgi:preprotein translocase subunit YajC